MQEKHLKDDLDEKREDLNPDIIINAVCKYFSVSKSDIVGKKKKQRKYRKRDNASRKEKKIKMKESSGGRKKEKSEIPFYRRHLRCGWLGLF